MMTEKQNARVLELKGQIEGTAATPSGAPVEVREAVLELAQELGRSGVTARALAGALGLHETTLSRWKRDPQAAPRGRRRPSDSRAASARDAGFRVVELAAPQARSKPRTPTAGLGPATPALRVAHAPSGLVIDGLDVESLAALLRRLS
jgi:hypothetical protein